MAESAIPRGRPEREVPSLKQAMRDLKRVARLMRPYWRMLAKGTAMTVCISVVGMILPYFAKLYFDEVYPTHNVSLLAVLVVGTFVLTLTTTVMSAVKGFYTSAISVHLNRSMGLMFFNHLQHLTVRFFDEHRVGEINSRFSNVSASVQTVTRVFETVMLNGTFVLLVPPLLIMMNPQLALLSLISIPLTTAVSTAASRWVRRFSQQGMEASAELSAFQVETMTNVRLVKGMAAEPFVFRSAHKQIHRAMDLQMRSSVLGQTVNTINNFVRAAGVAVFSYVAWNQILQQRMTLGDFTAFSMYIGYLTGPIGSFASLFMEFQTSAVSFSRMFEYLDLPVEQDPSLAFEPERPIVHHLSGAICFSGVTFGYVADKPVIRDVSFDIPEGTVTAVVGASGAGKSSFLRLICGMERPQSGEIRFGDTRIDDIPLPDLRRQIAVVWQEVGLLRGTIRDNLTYALDDVPQHRVDEAIRVACLTDVVDKLPNGLETTVAEGGATLSGGQRQRLAIARALLRDARILLLDEAMSNIDPATEGEIFNNGLLRGRGRTVLYVTHRLATAALADRIFVMDAGKLVGAGTHTELLETNAVYSELYKSATSSFEQPRRARMVGGPPSGARI